MLKGILTSVQLVNIHFQLLASLNSTCGFTPLEKNLLMSNCVTCKKAFLYAIPKKHTSVHRERSGL